MQKEKSDSAKAAVGVALPAHTPMMAHYPRMTYKCASVLEFFI